MTQILPVLPVLLVAALAACRAASATSASDGGARTTVRSGYAPVNGLRLYYEVHGDLARGTPLVLLPGGGSTIDTSFGKVLPTLAAHRPVIALEEQAHGHTADIDRPLTFENTADDAVALLDQLAVTRADFLGYSNGGSTALQIAIRHPERVRRLVIASAAFRADGFVPGFMDSMCAATLASMPAELKAAYLRVAPRPEDLPRLHDKCVQRMLSFEDVPTEVVRAIEAPALVLIGDADIVRPEHAVELFRLLPRGRLAVLPLTDHMTLPLRADWEASMVETFLDAPPSEPQ